MHSVDEAEIQNFSKDSSHWWDENGPFKPLHKLNPTRLQYIKAQICKAYNRDEQGLKALKDLSILDIGCGGGLVCEPLSRLGAEVSGIDADANAIAVAQEHAAQMGLDIDYKNAAAEDLDKQYDVVLALEIIEHVADIPSFVASCVKLCKPGGLLIFSTLNRTPKSFALGIVAAEYILRWVPQGTHSWKKFVKPSELARELRKHNVNAKDVTGVAYDPLHDSFSLSKTDVAVNYFLSGQTAL
jgi:2-polyprenyl-6-hydroxyphenyl methylase/3-demethylubiquinone-9 3-methyltransferase